MFSNLKFLVAAFSLCVLQPSVSGQPDDSEALLPPIQPADKEADVPADDLRPTPLSEDSLPVFRDRPDSREGGSPRVHRPRDDDDERRTIDPSTIRVLKDGEPVANALVVGYRGYPIEVTEDENGRFQVRITGGTLKELPRQA